MKTHRALFLAGVFFGVSAYAHGFAGHAGWFNERLAEWFVAVAIVQGFCMIVFWVFGFALRVRAEQPPAPPPAREEPITKRIEPAGLELDWLNVESARPPKRSGGIVISVPSNPLPGEEPKR